MFISFFRSAAFRSRAAADTAPSDALRPPPRRASGGVYLFDDQGRTVLSSGFAPEETPLMQGGSVGGTLALALYTLATTLAGFLIGFALCALTLATQTPFPFLTAGGLS